MPFDQLLRDETRQYLLRGMLWLSSASLVLLWVTLLSLLFSPHLELDFVRVMALVLPFSLLCLAFIGLYFFRFRHSGFHNWVYGHLLAMVVGWLVVMWMLSHGGASMLTAVETLCDILMLLMAIALFPSLRLTIAAVFPLLLLSAYFRFELMPESWLFNLVRTFCLAVLLLSGREIIYGWFRKAVRRDAEKRKLLKHFRKMALVDGLTGLSNRRHFDDILEQEIRAASRTGHSLCLILLDIDFFKRLNDSLGHQAGDDCLRRIGKLLGSTSRRPRDLAARYGGEEFAILLPETSLAGAEEVATKIARLLTQAAIPHPDSDVGSAITVSQGLVKWQAGMEAVPLLAAADEALYEAKQRGRNQFRVASISA
ncbi:GGDEF domain-containing protein [Shewanella jiangmenensis]|uniref:GGDEF domain-containing protein n=1 Tax=Shewanella jiangmenensis TaxID=2837387 RepID=UPI0032D8C2B2